jgi:hypothetical protein
MLQDFLPKQIFVLVINYKNKKSFISFYAGVKKQILAAKNKKFLLTNQLSLLMAFKPVRAFNVTTVFLIPFSIPRQNYGCPDKKV